MEKKVELTPDLIKGVLIVLVVIGHVIRGLFNAEILRTEGVWKALDTAIYLFHMPMFFFLSGLFIEKSTLNRKLNENIKKWIYVLVFPLVFWSYLQFGLQYLFSGSVNSKITLTEFLSAPIPPRQQFWFLSALFQLNLFVGVIAGLFNSRLFLILTFAASVFFGLYGGGDFGVGFYIAKYSAFFIAGMFAGKLSLIKPTSFKSLCSLGFFVAVLSMFVVWNNVLIRYEIIFSMLCVISFYLAFFLMRNLKRQDPKGFVESNLSLLGMNSMIIYLAHVIFSASYRSVLLKLDIYNISAHFFGGVFFGVAGPLFLGFAFSNISSGKRNLIIESIFPFKKKRIVNLG